MTKISYIIGLCALLMMSDLVRADGALSQELLTCDDQIFARPDPMAVVGNAAYSVPPELTIISTGLDVTQPTASAALQMSANIMAAAVAAIKALGVTTEELATSNLSVSEQYDSVFSAKTQQYTQVFKGFQVSQSLVITSKLVNKAGSIIDAAVKNGMNRVDSVTFDSKPATKKLIQDSLIANAISDARKKADLALTPLGASVLSIKDLSINDYQYITPDPNTSYKQYNAANNAAGAPIGTPVQSVTQVISVSVTVTYLINTAKK